MAITGPGVTTPSAPNAVGRVAAPTLVALPATLAQSSYDQNRRR
jgi:hypothetical protein